MEIQKWDPQVPFKYWTFTWLSLRRVLIFWSVHLFFFSFRSFPFTSLPFIDLLCLSQSLLASAAASAFTSSFPTARKPLQWARDAAALLRHAFYCGQQTKCNPLPVNHSFLSSCLFSFFLWLLFFFVSKLSCLIYSCWTSKPNCIFCLLLVYFW